MEAEAGGLEVSLQRSWGNISSSLYSPLLAPFIKPISILKAVRSPSVRRLAGSLTPCLPHSLVYCSLINPPEGADPASGSSAGRPGLKGVPGVLAGAGYGQRQIPKGRGLGSFQLPTLTPPPSQPIP